MVLLQIKKLLTVFEEMSARYPEDAQLKFSQAILLQEDGRHADALQIADEILEMERDPNIILLKTTALKDLDRLDEAKSYLKMQVEDMPTNLNVAANG